MTRRETEYRLGESKEEWVKRYRKNKPWQEKLLSWPSEHAISIMFTIVGALVIAMVWKVYI